jgi:hypothetical protein
VTIPDGTVATADFHDGRDNLERGHERLLGESALASGRDADSKRALSMNAIAS